MTRSRDARCFIVILAMAMAWLVVVLPKSALAAPSGDCTLTLTLGDSSGSATTDMVGGVVALYRVAGVTDDHTAYDPAQGQFASSAAARSVASLNQQELDAQNANIAKELERQAKASDISALVLQGIRNGEVRFESLDEGLYLAVQTKLSNGRRKITPFLVSLPDAGGNLNVVALPKHGTITEDDSDGGKGGDNKDSQEQNKNGDTNGSGSSGEAGSGSGSAGSTTALTNTGGTTAGSSIASASRLPQSGDTTSQALVLVAMVGTCLGVLGALLRRGVTR